MLSVFLVLILFSTGILSSEVFVCENNNLNISCPSSQSIHIDYAFFGRNNRVTCPKSRYDQNTQCSSFNNATEVLRQRCEAQQNCTVPASTQVFGDPCRGVYKFLQVNYTCVTQVEIHLVGCPHTTLSLTCPADTVVQVTSADYGRHSTTLCPYVDPGAMQNTQCSLSETQKLSKQCNGFQRCDIYVDAVESVDPCVGTYKYISVDYICKKVVPEVVCGVNEEYGCDNPCSRHCHRPRFCQDSCDTRCICKAGFRRDSATGRCIDENYCPLSSVRGGTHEVFSECDANCQSLCFNNRPTCAGTPCVAGYICAGSYVRDTVTGRCVRPADCYLLP